MPLGFGGTPTLTQLKELIGQAGAQHGRKQGAQPKEKSATRKPATQSSAAGAAPAEPSVEPVASPHIPGTPNLDENGDELDYVDDVEDLDHMDPGLPEGLNLDDTIHSIHSVPRTPGHWDDEEDLDTTTVLEYSRTGTTMGEGVEPLLASTPSHFSSSLAAPIVPFSPASITVHVTALPQGSVPALPKEDILAGPTAEATTDKELNLLGAAAMDGSPVEALNPGLREAATLSAQLNARRAEPASDSHRYSK